MIKGDFELSRLYTTVIIYAGILVVSLVSSYIQAIVLQKTGQKIVSKIREDLFAHIEGLSHEQLNKNPVGRLVTRVVNDTDSISHMFTGIGNFSAYIETGLIALGLNDTAALAYIFGLVFLLMLYDYLNKDNDLILTVTQKHPAFQWCFYTALGLFVVFFAQKGVAAEFVYFQF